ELLPIFIDRDGSIRWLSLAGGGSWRAANRGDLSPHDIVLDALRVFGIGPFVAHSTSWRYDSTLMLTYLILLPTLHSAPPAGFEVRSVGREALARGDLAAPPPEI